jgi:hypothetical protein
LRSMGVPDWRIRFSSAQPGTLYSNPVPIELERIATPNLSGPSRPSWRQSELDAGRELAVGFRPQVSFKEGLEVPYGTRGSVRPDYYGALDSRSIEIKNYDLSNMAGQSRLVDVITAQAQQRAQHLPGGTLQSVVIDVRGQSVSREELRQLIERIVSQSNGTLRPSDITVKR